MYEHYVSRTAMTGFFTIRRDVVKHGAGSVVAMMTIPVTP